MNLNCSGLWWVVAFSIPASATMSSFSASVMSFSADAASR